MRAWSVRAVFRTGLQFALICFSPFTLFSQSPGGASSGAAALAPYGSVGTGPGVAPLSGTFTRGGDPMRTRPGYLRNPFSVSGDCSGDQRKSPGEAYGVMGRRKKSDADGWDSIR
jgi:hypothetical protein